MTQYLIRNEFEKLNRQTRRKLAEIVESEAYQNSPSLSQVNHFKNRYNNIYSLETTRVKLKTHSDHDLDNDYINANYISGLGPTNDYIATQAPLPCTIKHFWLMVWENNSSRIVMLTSFRERGIQKADRYWPKIGASCRLGFFYVKTRSEKRMGEYLIHRTFQLTFQSKSRTIHHFQYLEWPDSGRPQSTRTIRRLIRKVNRGQKIGPLIVHCSAGIGRTGTFISIDLGLKEMCLGWNVNVPAIVKHLRTQRSLMVQSLEQYQFIYQAIGDEKHLVHNQKKNINTCRTLSLSAPSRLCRSAHNRDGISAN